MSALHSPGVAFLPLASGAMCFDPGRVKAPSEALFDPGNPQLGASPVQVGGRRSAWFVSGGFGGAVLRHYRRGGMVARVSRNHYLWMGASATRSFAEFHVLRYLQEQGVRVPAPLAAAYWRAGPFYRAAILIERIPRVRTLAETLDSPQAVADAVFAMHQAQIWHADLNAHNILLDEHGRAWLIDFDRARRRSLSAADRQGNLLRLRRSMQKLAGRRGLACWTQIEQAYQQIAGGAAA